jgi:hypothetical protein
LWKGILVSLAVALLPAIGGSTAHAGDLYPRGVHPLFLLSSPNVRAELNLSAEQAAEIDEISADFVLNSAAVSDMLSEQSGSMTQDEYLAICQGLEADYATIAHEALSESQSRRLDQIGLQVRGVTGLLEEWVLSDLGVDDATFERMVEAAFPYRDLSMQVLAWGRQGSLTRAEVAVGIEDCDAWAKAAAVSELSDDQRAALAELEGEKIDFAIGPLKLTAKIKQ